MEPGGFEPEMLMVGAFRDVSLLGARPAIVEALVAFFDRMAG